MWDLPTRLLHGLLAGSFTGAFALAVFARHRAPTFPLHMILGAIAVLVVLLRVAWGLVGSKYARFGSFTFAPSAVLGYLRGVFGRGARDRERSAGHNPANAWAAFGMLFGILGAGVTGALLTKGVRVVRPLHEAFAYGTAALVAVHLVGIALASIQRRENVALGMLDGRQLATSTQAIRSSHPVVAFAMLALVGGAAGVLLHGYDGDTRTVSVPGLGEVQLGGRGRRAERGARAARGHRGAGPRDRSGAQDGSRGRSSGRDD